MATNQQLWKTLRNNNSRKQYFYCELTTDHPLRNVMVTERIARKTLGSASSTGYSTPISSTATISEPLAQALKELDPLTEFAMHEEMDPLSKFAAEAGPDIVDKSVAQQSIHKISNKIDSWSHRKAAILQKYTTSEKLSMVTSFLMEGEKVVMKAQSTTVDKMQHRLEQVDSFEEGPQRKLDLSQAEYVYKIEQLNRELVSAWSADQRVKALKIVIQCAKMLADTDVVTFYPSKFVLITDVLDCFGNLVYDRLKSKATRAKFSSTGGLPDDFTPDMVSDSAKETCLNWFYKIASIRELVPRLYVEMTLLRSYNFISSNECPEAVSRITEMIQGVGNPLVAVYARCYLCRVALTVTSKESSTIFLRQNFERFLESYQHIFSRSVKADLQKQKMSIPTYMSLYTPALDFIVESIVNHSSDNVFSDILTKCNSSLILNTIMSGFKPLYVAERTLQFLSMIGQCTDDGIPLHMLLRTLGLCVSMCSPPVDHCKQILNAVWSNVAQLKDTTEYISCIEVWIQFIAKYFSVREINTVFGDVVDRMIASRSHEKHTVELKNTLQNVIRLYSDFEACLAMENFLPFVDLFHKESDKVDVCKYVLTSSHLKDHKIDDPVVINALMFLGGILHDSVNALTPEDENRQIGDVLCNIITIVDYGRDFEQQLQFYVDARGAFANLDSVLAQLVQCVNRLAVTTRQVVRGLHTRKTGDFVRACAAYCFITIPSIESWKIRLRLYLLSGQVALYNYCLGQADACFKAILTTIAELNMSADTEDFLLPYVRQFLSVLLIVPDNPERGPLGLLRKLINIIRNLEWTSTNNLLAAFYLNVIDLFSALSQDTYAYHVDKVESNDSLWGSDPHFLQEIDNLISIIVRELLSLLKELGPCRKQCQIALEFFLKIATRADLSVPQTEELALNLWKLCIGSEQYSNIKYIMTTKAYMKNYALNYNNAHLQRLLDGLEI